MKPLGVRERCARAIKSIHRPKVTLRALVHSNGVPATQAAGAAWLFRDGLHTLSALHAAGLVAYGLRLVLFCRWRDSLSCFQNRKK